MIKQIGIDLGGTSCRFGAMNENGKMIWETVKPTNAAEMDGDSMYRFLVDGITEIPQWQDTEGIGIAIAGSVDHHTRRVVTAANIPFMIGYPLAEKLEEELGKHVAIENDARVAAYGEALMGAGKGYDIVCYVTLSTGAGGGCVINGRIYEGASGLGGYFPRIILDGSHTVDGLLSGRALLEKAHAEINRDITTVTELFELAKDGNRPAEAMRQDFIRYLTALLLTLSATFNPDIIVVGGGITNSSSLFLPEVEERFRTMVHPLASKTVITSARLKEPGLYGACLLASQK